jgi:predicted ribosome quality control (RQC) complex YloA/Tae2 family protein
MADVSKPIAYDSLLVRALAAELHVRFVGQRVRAVRFDEQTRLLQVFFRRATLEWNLDPSGGSLAEKPAFGAPTGTQLAAGTIVTAIRARPDDRALDWVLQPPDARAALILRITLLPNRRSAQVIDDRGPPPHDMDGGPIAAGHADRPPRRGAESAIRESDFVARLAGVAPADRTRALLAEFAYTSPINAAAILGAAATHAGASALAEAWHRYNTLVDAPPSPVVLDPDHVAQPYPQPLPGVTSTPFTSLLAAFAAVQAAVQAPSQTAVLDALRRRQHALEKRSARMRHESMHASQDATELRRIATLLLSQLSTVRRGQREVVLDDWSGGTVHATLDPGLDAAENANRLFDRARRRERAALRLPALIEQVSAHAARFAVAADALARGEISLAEATSLLPGPVASAAAPSQARLPYRRYRTSGGLEVRVGRNSRANDELTMRHSSPEDIWMHARDAAGAHVVLRWTHREENPPATDLAEAAVLAALNSRAATSGTVAVDWTRRKYVRKPRKAKPGLVTVERTRTLFVVPDPRLEERLRQG